MTLLRHGHYISKNWHYNSELGTITHLALYLITLILTISRTVLCAVLMLRSDRQRSDDERQTDRLNARSGVGGRLV
jgi:hypothetical protein